MPLFLAALLCLSTGAAHAATKVSAHRGDCKNAPENTVAAIRQAVCKGAHQVEFDVQLTKDGFPVLMHDGTVDRTTDGSGAVKDLTFESIRGLDAGSWFSPRYAGERVPTLQEALQTVPPQVLCNVHLKGGPAVAETAVRVIRDMHRLGQCVLACTTENAVAARAIVPEIRICNMSGPREGDQLEYIKQTADGKAALIQFKKATPDLLKAAVDRAHEAGITVNYYRADTEEDILRMVEAGVDYVLTNDLDTCLRVCAQHGAAPACTTRACAHRGDNKNAPENTIPAFESAVRKGAHQIEFDVYLSKDGKEVVIHDTKVDRTTNGTGNVSDLTFAELRALDAGSWFGAEFKGLQIPTLRETLEAIPHTVLCNVHLKNAPGVAESAARTIAGMGRLDHCFLACTLEQAAAAKAIAPGIQICNMSRQSGPQDAYAALSIEHNTEFLQLYKGLDGIAERVTRLHNAGLTCNFFGASDPGMIRTLAEARVDFILTDDLDTCLATLAEFGVKPLPTE